MWQEFSLFCYLDGFVAWICLSVHWLLAVMGVMHEADDTYLILIRSTWSCYWLDKFLTLALNTLALPIFDISLDLSTIHFTHFSGCWASFVCNCHSILECGVMFSGVKLSIRSFNLFLWVGWVSLSAGGSVVPEVSWNLAFSNGFTYLKFDYCEQCSWHSGKTGSGDCGLASPFLLQIKCYKEQQPLALPKRRGARMSSCKRTTKARVRPKLKDSAATMNNPINNHSRKTCSCEKICKNNRGPKIHQERSKCQTPENKLVAPPQKCFVSLQNVILSSCLTFDDGVYYRTSDNTFIPISNSEKPVAGNKCYVQTKDIIIHPLIEYLSNAINQMWRNIMSHMQDFH